MKQYFEFCKQYFRFCIYPMGTKFPTVKEYFHICQQKHLSNFYTIEDVDID